MVATSYEKNIDYSMLYRFADQLQPTKQESVLSRYLTIRIQARVFYEQIVNEAQPSLVEENEGE